MAQMRKMSFGATLYLFKESWRCSSQFKYEVELYSMSPDQEGRYDPREIDYP